MSLGDLRSRGISRRFFLVVIALPASDRGLIDALVVFLLHNDENVRTRDAVCGRLYDARSR